MSQIEDLMVAEEAADVTPNNSTVVSFRALYVGTGGDLSVMTKYGTTLTFKNVPNAFVLELRVIRVRSTGTTASDIIGFK